MKRRNGVLELAQVLRAVDDGRSYRWIARDLGISKNTADIVKRHRADSLDMMF